MNESLTFTDTHAHLYASEFNADRAEMVRRALDAGVTRLFLPNIDSSSIQPMLNLVWDFPDNCFPMMGLHPCSVGEHYEAEVLQVERWLGKRKFYAIGEIGIDLYWDKTFVKQQEEAFLKQCRLGLKYDLPVVIHSREATQVIIDLVKKSDLAGLRGVFHCFSGTIQQAEEIVAMGFYLGIGGPLTYKKSELPGILPHISIDRLLLETDSPYLTPVPHRGKRNESSYIPLIASRLSEVMNISFEELAEKTTANSKELFKI
jgi:TatD DNase family protein